VKKKDMKCGVCGSWSFDTERKIGLCAWSMWIDYICRICGNTFERGSREYRKSRKAA